MEDPARVVTSEDLHATYLDRSRKELQQGIEQYKRALTEVRHLITADVQQSGSLCSYGYRNMRSSLPLLKSNKPKVARMAPQQSAQRIS